MRRVILKMHSSIDGFVLGPGDDLDWAFRTFDDEMAGWEVAGLWEAGVHAMGRATYEVMAEHWPASNEAFAPPMNEIPKLVFSQTLERADWGPVRVARGEPGEEIAALRAEPGEAILVHGGPRFAGSLIQRDLVDEYRLVVHPVAIGEGEPLFHTRLDLTLADVRRFPAGAVALVYTRP